MKFPVFLSPFTGRSVFVICFSLLHLFFWKSYGQTYPLNQNIHAVKWESYQQPQNTPKYLVTFKDPVTANKVTRISDRDIFGCDCETLRHRYAKNQPWNADGSKILTAGSRAKILDGNTYQILGTVTPRSLWSNIDPNITFDAGGNKFYKKNIVTNRETVLNTFSDYQSVSVGYGEGNISKDDRWVALIAKNGKNQTVLVYDILKNTVVGSRFLGTTPVDWVSVSQSGKFVVIRFKQNGGGKNQGIKSYNQKMQNEMHLLSLGGHGDLGYDMAGNEVFVSGARYNGYSLSYTRLDNGYSKGLWKSAWKPGDRGIAIHHVSTRNLNRPGWAFISTDHQAKDPLVYDAPKEVIAIKLDDSETIERFAKHHTKFDGAKSSYNHQAQAVPNRDGTKVIFASNWHNSQWMKNKYPMMWVVEAEKNSNNIAVENLDVLSESADLSITKTLQLTVIFEPKNATNKNGTWRSSNNKIATVNAKGLVTPVSLGEVNIAFKSADGGIEKEVEVKVFSETAQVSAGKDQQICEGSTATLIASGGATYLWSTGDKANSITISPNQTTNYTVIAYDYNGKKMGSNDATVKVTPPAKVNAGRDVTINAGERVTLTATGAKYFMWSTGDKKASTTVSPTFTTTYSLRGKNGDECEGTDTVKVIVRDGFAGGVTANAGRNQQICQGASAILTATGGSSYRWSNGASTASITVSPNQTTKYTVTAYDSTGKNSDSNDVTVQVNPLAKVNAGRDVTINAGERVTLTATGAKYFMWSTGDKKASTTVSPTSTTTYSLRGKNGDECEGTDTVKVIVRDGFAGGVTANAGRNQQICQGASAILTATGGSSYRWSTGASTASITVSPNQTTKYTVTAYDSTGKNSDSNDVTVQVNPLAKVNAGRDVTINAGERVTLTATGAKYYMWSTGDKKASTIVSPTSTTTYSLRGKNGDECEGADTVKVIVIQSSSKGVSSNAGSGVGVSSDVKIANGTEVDILQGESIILSAIGADTYKWSNGKIQQNIIVSPRFSDSYSVVGYSNKGSSVTSIRINVYERIIASAGQDVSISANENTVLTAKGPENSAFLWSTGETTKSITVSPEKDTEYSVLVYHSLDSDTAKVLVSIDNSRKLHVTEPLSDLKFQIYPNPTHKEINIKISGLTNVSSINLYDFSGKSLYSESLNDSDKHNYVKTLDLSDYASGIYLLQLVDNQRVITRKVILK